MKLGMLIPEFPTQTHVFFWREILALRALGAEVSVISTRRPEEQCPHPFAAEAVKGCHYLFPPQPGAVARKVLSLPQAALHALQATGGVARRARVAALGLAAAELADFGTRAGLDHIHIHSFADAAHVGSISRAMGGPPYSLHLHGDLPVYGTDHLLKARGASFAAAAARPMQRQLVEAGIPEERTVTMWMGVDTTRFTPAEAPPPPGPLRLISVSRLALCKGHRYALRALRLALDAGLDATYEIIGRGPDAEEIRAEVVRLGLEAKVKMAGALGEEQILERLRASDACVLSSIGLGEASPVAVMEAMSCGLAPVVSVIGGTPDMIRHGETGLLVAQEDVPGLCAAFQRLRDSAERARLGTAARAFAAAEFDSRVLARKLLDRIELAHRPTKD